jgi:hypothetical protein
MPQICDMTQTALLPLRRKACCGFFRPKNPTASAGFEPVILGTRDQFTNEGLSDADLKQCRVDVKPASQCRKRIGFSVWLVRVEPNCVETMECDVLGISFYKSIQLLQGFSTFK